MGRRTSEASIVLVLLLVGVSPAQSASFDCSKATSKLEKLVCSNSQLSALDDSLNQAYRRLIGSAKDAALVKSDQLAWLDDEIAEARDDELTLEQAQEDYLNRVQVLRTRFDALTDSNRALHESTSCISVPGRPTPLGCRVISNSTVPELPGYEFQLQRSGPNVCSSVADVTKDTSISMVITKMSDTQRQVITTVDETDFGCGGYSVNYYGHASAVDLVVIDGGIGTSAEHGAVDKFMVYRIDPVGKFIKIDQTSELEKRLPPELIFGLDGVQFDYKALTAVAPLAAKSTNEYPPASGCAKFVVKVVGSAFVPVDTKIEKGKDPASNCG